MKGKGRKFGLTLVVIVVLAMVLVVALTSTAMACEKHYTFDASKFNMKLFDHRIDWSKVAWCNVDFSKVKDWVSFWKNFDWKDFHWGCKPKPKPTTTEKCTTTEHVTTTGEHVTTTCEHVTTTAAEETTEVVIVNTGGGGTAGPGGGIWALGFFSLALAGGLGWTAVRPALKRK
jgi:hypothetical protein